VTARRRGAAREPELPIRTARLMLREFDADDLPALSRIVGDARVREHAPGESRALATARVASAGGARRRGAAARHFELAVVSRRSDMLLGACDIAFVGPRTADIGYLIAPRHWGHGYGTEVARALVEFGFGQLGANRLSAIVAVDNERSRRVLANAGFQWEGLMRRHVRVAGRSWDCHLYVIERARRTPG
jgi:RimJ/RimL family protein N-acetyltransferase